MGSEYVIVVGGYYDLDFGAGLVVANSLGWYGKDFVARTRSSRVCCRSGRVAGQGSRLENVAKEGC